MPGFLGFTVGFFDLAHCGLLVLSMTECTNVILMGQKPVGLWTSQIRPQRLQMNLVLEVTATSTLV